MIAINLEKAKPIAHEKRRELRAKEFAPLDDLMAKRLPNVDLVEVEGQRWEIRSKYDVMQVAIDNAQTIDEIKTALAHE